MSDLDEIRRQRAARNFFLNVTEFRENARREGCAFLTATNEISCARVPWSRVTFRI